MNSRDESIREMRRNFLGHINAEPDNLFLRSQYADWLEEEVAQTNGDADAVHARLIRAQIGLAGFYCGPGRTEEEAKIAYWKMRLAEYASLCEGRGAVFPAGWGTPPQSCAWDRGFISSLTAHSAEMVSSAGWTGVHLVTRLRMINWCGVDHSLPAAARKALPILKRLELPNEFIRLSASGRGFHDVARLFPNAEVVVDVGSGTYVPVGNLGPFNLDGQLERLRTQVLRQQGVPESVIDRWANEAVPRQPPE
jgi:uncharacterized protein (TIGR02996 family)